jgi:hypothetical protein
MYEVELISRFGGPELLEQVWPVNKLVASNLAMVTSYENHRGIVDRYWVSSEGTYFFAEPSAPLFIDSNTAANPNQLCFVSKDEAPFYQSENITLRHESAILSMTEKTLIPFSTGTLCAPSIAHRKPSCTP